MPTIQNWSFFEKTSFRFFFVFVLLFIFSFSFPHEYIPDIGKYTSPFFEALVKWCAKNIFRTEHPFTSELISDSTGLYIHTAILLVLSALISAAWSFTDRKTAHYNFLSYWFIVIVRYYLALQLLVYGFNKIFKWQFYLPEPNTLFATVGNTYQDLLYWSTIGSSWSYTVFLGVVEVLSAGLLLFRRTQLLGALISIAVMLNVVMVNFSFDISVKLYSCFLLFLSSIIITLDFKKLIYLFILQKPVNDTLWILRYDSKKKKKIHTAVKTFVIVFMLFDTLAMYIKSGNFNDDNAPRPLFHGAYDVDLFVKNKDTLAPLMNDSFRWKRMFIHGRGYLITQGMTDEMEDYTLKYDTLNKFLLIDNYGDSVKTKLHYTQLNDSALILNGKFYGDSLIVYLRKINLNKLPLLQKEFNWTIDD